MAWVLILLLVAISLAATVIGRGGSEDGHAVETPRRELLLWFGSKGEVTLDGKPVDPDNWKEPWRAALAVGRQRQALIGADDDVPYARLHEAYAAARQSRVREAGYALDRQGRAVVLTELTQADVSTQPGPHVLAIEADGRLTWDGTTVEQHGLGRWMKQQVMPKLAQDHFVALVELRVDPRTPYGRVKQLLNAVAEGGPPRIASYEESETVARKLLPLPPVQKVPPPGSGCPSPPPGITCQ